MLIYVVADCLIFFIVKQSTRISNERTEQNDILIEIFLQMSTRHKSSKQKEPKIECGLGEKCARRNCTFKHPDTRNLEANLRKAQQE